MVSSYRSPHLFWLGLFTHRAFSSAQDDDTRGRMGSYLRDMLRVLELAVLYYDTSSPLEKGRAKGAGWMCRAAAPFYVAESMPSVPDVLPSIPHFLVLILQNSASSRQSIPCPSGTPFSKGERVLSLFQYSAALPYFYAPHHSIFLCAAPPFRISHFLFLIHARLSSTIHGRPAHGLTLSPNP